MLRREERLCQKRYKGPGLGTEDGFYICRPCIWARDIKKHQRVSACASFRVQCYFLVALQMPFGSISNSIWLR